MAAAFGFAHGKACQLEHIAALDQRAIDKLRKILAEHVRQDGWIEPEAACDSACVVGRDQIDGGIIVILVFLVLAIDIEGGPAALSDKDLVP
jgi:hypothetical protein